MFPQHVNTALWCDKYHSNEEELALKRSQTTPVATEILMFSDIRVAEHSGNVERLSTLARSSCFGHLGLPHQA